MPRFLDLKVKEQLYLRASVNNEDVRTVAGQLGISVSHAYNLTEKYRRRMILLVNDVIGADDEKHEQMSPAKKSRFILSSALNCRGSLEGIQRHLEDVFHMHVSIGEISETLKRFSVKAEEILKTISLERVKVICADEIFEGQSPVMAVIDPDSTYVISMMLAEDRSAETWQIVMEYAKDCGLHPERSISDAGKGLLSGIPQAFQGISCQIDVFHIMKDIGEACRNVINSFFSRLTELEEAYDQILYGKYRSKKAEEKCIGLEKEIERLYERAYIIETLNGWIREMLGFTGYTAKEVLDTLLWIADELAASGVKRASFHQKVKAFRKQALTSVGYLEALEKNLVSLADSMGYRSETFRNLYRLSAMKSIHPAFVTVYEEIRAELKGDYYKAMKLVRDLVRSTYRASSIVENLNSRIRTYMNAKRYVSGCFFPLLQLYINTKKYRRSEVPERVGKSPLELLTGEHKDFYELLGL